MGVGVNGMRVRVYCCRGTGELMSSRGKERGGLRGRNHRYFFSYPVVFLFVLVFGIPPPRYLYRCFATTLHRCFDRWFCCWGATPGDEVEPADGDQRGVDGLFDVRVRGREHAGRVRGAPEGQAQIQVQEKRNQTI